MLHSFGGNLVAWCNKKQLVAARSSAETDTEILLKEFGYDCRELMSLYCNYKAAINIAHNPVQHVQTKHNKSDRHFIKEKLLLGLICPLYMKIWEQLADILMKGVSNSVLHSALCKRGCETSSAYLEGEC
jgi:hypothetical protein